MVRGRNAPRRIRFAKQRAPKALVLSYGKELIGLARHMRAVTESAIGHELAGWVHTSDRPYTRKDGASDDVITKFAGIRIALEKGEFSTSALKARAEKQGRRTAEAQKAELQRQLSVAIGVQVPISDKTLGPKVEAFTAENVGLIQSIPQQSLQQVQQVILRGLSGGDRADQIAEDIQKRFDVSESRAALIANDQTLKFFSSLNETRQREIGLTHFIWATANTERTCDICEPLDGKRFSWANAPGGGPGQIHPNCMCSADPDVEALLDSL